MQNGIASKKEMFKTLCNHKSEKNIIRYNAIHNKTKKVVPRAIKMEAEKGIETFSESAI